MELRDYSAALERRWRWWVGLALLGVLLAGTAAALTPRSYTAAAQVFVASTQEGTSPQFVVQRVKSYPDVAISARVLAPVVERLELTGSVTALRAQVTATNPVDTSQVVISVADPDADRAADIANAVAQEFSSVVPQLERPTGGRSPVSLTVTNPATAPSSPTVPDTGLLLALGLVSGLGLGVAAAVLRDRTDQHVHTPADVVAAWGDPAPEVLPAPTRREAGSRAATVLARRIERRAGQGRVHVVLTAPTGAGRPAGADLAAQLGAALRSHGLSVRDTVADGTRATDGSAGGPVDVELSWVAADDSLARWRVAARQADGVLVVCPAPTTDRSDVAELAQLLDAVGAATLAVVLISGRSARPRSSRRGSADAVEPAGEREPVPARTR